MPPARRAAAGRDPASAGVLPLAGRRRVGDLTRCRRPPALPERSDNHPAGRGAPRRPRDADGSQAADVVADTAARGTPLVRFVAAQLEANHRARREAMGRLGLVPRPLQVAHGPVHAWHRPARAPGPPWIFIHGFLGQATNWLEMLRRLEPRCPEVWVLDMPGHGISPAPEVAAAAPEASLCTAYMEASLGEALAEICRQPGLVPPVLVTTSAGAFLGARAIASAPPLARANAVAAPPPPAGVSPLLCRAHLVAICPLGAPMGELWRRRMLARLSAGPQTALPGSQPPWVEFVHRVSVRALVERPFQARLLGEFPHVPMLTPAQMGALPPDTLVISGGRDTLLTPHSHRLFRRHLPASAHCSLEPDFDHLAIVFRARRAAEAVDGWASDHPEPLLLSRPDLGQGPRWPWAKRPSPPGGR